MSRVALGPERIDALVFDVIGTLVDDDAAWGHVAELLAEETGLGGGAHLRERWEHLLERSMGAVVAGQAGWRPHRELVVHSAREAIAEAGGRASAGVDALAASLDDAYPAWPDVSPATAALRDHRFVVGFSNGDLDCLDGLARTHAIGWDLALSSGAARTFKPAPAAYRFLIDALRFDPERTLFVAAHPWDLRAAAEHGFRTAYVARPGADRPSSDDEFDLAVDDLTALVGLFAEADGSGSRGVSG